MGVSVVLSSDPACDAGSHASRDGTVTGHPLTCLHIAGHSNERNFVGLSVTPDGYIACGSEDNCVYTYYNTMPAPLCRHSFSSAPEDSQEVTCRKPFPTQLCPADSPS